MENANLLVYLFLDFGSLSFLQSHRHQPFIQKEPFYHFVVFRTYLFGMSFGFAVCSLLLFFYRLFAKPRSQDFMICPRWNNLSHEKWYWKYADFISKVIGVVLCSIRYLIGKHVFFLWEDLCICGTYWMFSCGNDVKANFMLKMKHLFVLLKD